MLKPSGIPHFSPGSRPTIHVVVGRRRSEGPPNGDIFSLGAGGDWAWTPQETSSCAAAVAAVVVASVGPGLGTHLKFGK